METQVRFEADGVILEGLLNRIAGCGGVVVSHPHSLYGGDMYNPVVEMLCRCYGRRGFSSLRLNFRGVGESGGCFEGGIGERADVLAAVGFLRDAGIRDIHLAGYSFGSWVMAGIRTLPEEVVAQLFIAPPVAFMDFAGIADIAGLGMVITGADDTIAPPDQIKGLLPAWNSGAGLVVVDGADHFFSGSFPQLEREVETWLSLMA